MNKDEALKMAIEMLEKLSYEYGRLLDGDQNYGLLPSEINADIIKTYYVKRTCQEALEQPAQEPVAWIEVTTHHEKYQTSKVILLDKGIKLPHDTLLYTHPAPSCQECENLKHDLEGYMDANKELINREWQGLSDDEIRMLEDIHKVQGTVCNVGVKTFARAIEQALKEKNT